MNMSGPPPEHEAWTCRLCGHWQYMAVWDEEVHCFLEMFECAGCSALFRDPTRFQKDDKDKLP